MSPHSSRLAQVLRRSVAGLRAGHVVALSVVAAAAFGLVGLRTVDLPGPRPITDGERLRIEVVHPVEPEIVSGSRMDVGELVEGFQGVPPPLPPLTDAMWSRDDGEAYPDEGHASPGPADRRTAETRTYYSSPEPEQPSPVRALQRWFGFDAPRRDFQAERAARRARLEAMEYHARERHAVERRRQDRAEHDRYAAERSWNESREPPPWREDRQDFDGPREGDGRDEEWRDERLPDHDDDPASYEDRWGT